MTSTLKPSIHTLPVLDCVISVCHVDHIEIWKYAAEGILRNILSKEYKVIVPEKNLSLFRKYTPYEIQIINEETILSSHYKHEITKYLSIAEIDPGRSSWIYQQFLKIEA